MLPSGRHVAVDPEPLTRLTLGVNKARNAHHLMAIREVEDLYRWVALLTLVAVDSLGSDQRDTAKDIPGAPDGFVGLPTGIRLADWRSVADEWSGEDVAAMAVFVDERVRPWIAEEMDVVRRCQEALRASPTTLPGMMAAMWEAGCHPVQDESGDELPLPASDFEARLGALLRARALLRESPNMPGVEPQTRDRLEGALAMCEQFLELPALPADATLAYWIEAVRNADPLGSATDRNRTWFPEQIAAECESLWNSAGEALREVDRDLYDIIELAAIGTQD